MRSCWKQFWVSPVQALGWLWLTARARKKQVKEVRALLDGTDKTSDEKLWLLNTKYLQQVFKLPMLWFSKCYTSCAPRSSFWSFCAICVILNIFQGLIVKNWIQYRYQRLNCWRRRYYLCGESMSRSIKKKTQVGVEWSLKNVVWWQDWIFIIL